MFKTWAFHSDINPDTFVDSPSYGLAQDYFYSIKEKLAPNGDCSLYEEVSFFSRIFRPNAEAKHINLNDLQLTDLMIDRAAIASPLRVSTPSVRLFDRKDDGQREEISFTNYLPRIKKEIKSQFPFTSSYKLLFLADEEREIAEENNKIRQESLQMLHSMKLFVQLLFNESLAEAYLKKLQENLPENKALTGLFNCLYKYDFNSDGFSKRDVLKNRQEYSKYHNALKNRIDSIEDEDKRMELLAYLARAKAFFYQRNDLNFTYASKPSRCYSKFKDKVELWGGRLGLAATIGAIACSVLAFSLPFMPFPVSAAVISGFATAALICTAIMVLTNLPRAMKNLGTAIYNFAHYGVAPTYQEVINVGLTGLSLLSAGVGGIVGGILQSTLFGNISGALLTASNLIKVGVNVSKEKKLDLQSGTMKHISKSSTTLQKIQAGFSEERDPLLLIEEDENSDEAVQITNSPGGTP